MYSGIISFYTYMIKILFQGFFNRVATGIYRDLLGIWLEYLFPMGEYIIMSSLLL